MPFVDITPSWWVILPGTAGLFLIYRLWSSADSSSLPRILKLGGAIHAAVLIALVASLLSPAIIIKKNIFHNPVIVLARDLSGSFLSGETLNLGKEYTAFKDTAFDHYGSRGFRIETIDFAESVNGAPPVPAEMPGAANESLENGHPHYLTNLNCLSDYVRDSLPWKNVQGIFLLSDGHANIPLGNKSIPYFSTPVYPVIFSPESFRDIQLDTVMVNEKGSRRKNTVNLTLEWTDFSKMNRELSIKIPGKDGNVFSKTMDAYDTSLRKHSLDVALSRSSVDCGSPSNKFTVILQSDSSDQNPFNDSITVPCPSDEKRTDIYFLNTVNSPDERWMIRTLLDEDEYKVTTRSWKKIKSLTDCSGAQIWLPAVLVKRHSSHIKKLVEHNCPVVVYGRFQTPIAIRDVWSEQPVKLGLSSRITIAPPYEAFFQNLHLNLSDITTTSVWFPREDSSFQCLLSIADKNNKGCVLSHSNAASFYRLAVSDFWKKSFRPNEPYTVKEQIKSLITGTAQIVLKESMHIQISFPEINIESLPFGISFKIKSSDQVRVRFIKGENEYAFKADKMRTAAGQNFYKIDSIVLSSGSYQIVLEDETGEIWTDSMEVMSKQHYEMSKLGFDLPALNNFAKTSLGAVLEGSVHNEHLQIKLPQFSKGQIKEVKHERIPLYNTRYIFLLILIFSTGYWYLRKKLTLD